MAIVVKWLTHLIVVQTFVGSIPISRPIKKHKILASVFHILGDFFIIKCGYEWTLTEIKNTFPDLSAYNDDCFLIYYKSMRTPPWRIVVITSEKDTAQTYYIR